MTTKTQTMTIVLRTNDGGPIEGSFMFESGAVKDEGRIGPDGVEVECEGDHASIRLYAIKMPPRSD